MLEATLRRGGRRRGRRYRLAQMRCHAKGLGRGGVLARLAPDNRRPNVVLRVGIKDPRRGLAVVGGTRAQQPRRRIGSRRLPRRPRSSPRLASVSCNNTSGRPSRADGGITVMAVVQGHGHSHGCRHEGADD